MNLGFDAKRVFFNSRGLGVYSRRLIDGLLSYSKESISLFSPLPPENESLTKYKKTSAKIITNKNPLWRSFGILNSINQEQVDLYHGLSNEIPFIMNNKSCPILVTIHDLLYLKTPLTFSAIDRMTYKFKTKYALDNADHIIAISENTRRDILNTYKISEDKITVHYQGIDDLYFNLLNDDELRAFKQLQDLPDEYFLYVGALAKNKNVLGLLKAYAALPTSCQLPLVLVGRGHQKTEIESFIVENSLGHLVSIKDYASNDLRGFYQNAKAFIFPSFYEGMGLPVIEAMACATPVLCSNASSLPEASGGICDEFSPGDIQEITETLKHFIQSSTWSDARRLEAQNHAQKFSLQKTTQSLLSLYNHYS